MHANIQLTAKYLKFKKSIFLLFFHIPKSLAPAKLIESIQNNISSFAKRDKDYAYFGIYDLQEKYLRKDLEKLGYDYDKG